MKFALLFLLSASLHADEVKRRIIGLSEPSREQDLRKQVRTVPGVELISLNSRTTEAVFRYDVARLITNFNPKKPPNEGAITKRLEELLRAASRGTFMLKSLATLSEDKMQKIEIQDGLLNCKACRYGAYIAVAKLDGFEHATVNESGLVTVWIDPARANRDALEAALKKDREELK